MKKILFPFFAVTLFLAGTAFAGKEMVVADFNDSDKGVNNLGGEYGTWNHDPNDDSQGCYSFSEPDDYTDPQKNYCIRLDYDVQSSQPAFNGFWMKLKNADVSKYDVLSFWIKGGSDGRFTSQLKVELRDDKDKRAIYGVQNVTDQWKEIQIDFKKTTSGLDWKKLTEFVVVFDDILATNKEGTVFIDQVTFKKK